MKKKVSGKSGGKKASKKVELKPFDKYEYYHRSVQSPEADVIFFKDAYKELKGKSAKSFREDFCGTFAVTCEWVKLDSQHLGFGIDLDAEPIAYGTEHHLKVLEQNQQKRIEIRQANVLDPHLPKTDIVAALNFSYYIFKDRKSLKAYFANALKSLNKDGIFSVDCFGGAQCMGPIEEETEHKDFSYFWDQDNYDPVTNFAHFYIHFKRKGEKKREKVFSYDWRMWTIPEIREAMEEVGFTKTHVYWEGTTKSGAGNGVFKRAEKGEDCEAWVAYVIGEK